MLNMITLGVSDIERSASFYESVFSQRRSKYSNDGIVFIRLTGIVLALFSHKALAKDANVESVGSGFKRFSMTYYASSEAEVDEITSSVEKLGGKQTKKPQKATWGVYSSYFCDPDDNLIEVAYNPVLPLSANGELDI